MSALAELTLSLLTATRGVVAAFGCLCIVTYAVIPCLTAVGELVVIEIPSEIAKWKLLKAQRAELQALEDRLAVLKKRRARDKRDDAQRAHEDYQVQANRRQEAQRRKQSATAQRAPVDAEEQAQPRVSRLRQPTVRPPTRTEAEKTSLPTRRLSRPLQLLSPNVPVDRQPVSAYVKASAGVTKPAEDTDRDRSRRAASQKARMLSLGDIFDDVDEENLAPKPRMWAQ